MPQYLLLSPAGAIQAAYSGPADGAPAGAVDVPAAIYAALPRSVAGWSYTGGALVAPVTPAPTAASATAALLGLLAQKQAAGVYFTPTGGTSPVLFPTAAASQPLLLGAWSALNASPALAADGDTYLAADGTPVALSMTDAKAMLAKALAYFRACNAHYASLHAAVGANPATDITAGWPVNT